MRRVFETRIAAPVEKVWAFHESVEALKALTPPDRNVTVMSEDTAVREGALHVLRVVMFGVPIVWKARITDVQPPFGFTDTAEKSPFAAWRHRHDFLPDGDGTLLRDTVEYRAPFGPLGALAHRLFIDRDIERMFAYRHRVTKEALEPG